MEGCTLKIGLCSRVNSITHLYKINLIKKELTLLSSISAVNHLMFLSLNLNNALDTLLGIYHNQGTISSIAVTSVGNTNWPMLVNISINSRILELSSFFPYN